MLTTKKGVQRIGQSAHSPQVSSFIYSCLPTIEAPRSNVCSYLCDSIHRLIVILEFSGNLFNTKAGRTQSLTPNIEYDCRLWWDRSSRPTVAHLTRSASSKIALASEPLERTSKNSGVPGCESLTFDRYKLFELQYEDFCHERIWRPASLREGKCCSHTT